MIFIKKVLKNIYFICIYAKSYKTTLKTKFKETGHNRGQGISVIVLDLKTNKFTKYVSIAEAARALNTYPKAIWRKVQNNNLYLDRYHIIKDSGDFYYKPKETKRYLLHDKYFYIIPKDYKYLFKIIKESFIVSRLFLLILMCIILYLVVFIYIDTYNIYIYSLQESRADHLKYILEHRFTSNNTSSNYELSVITEKMSKFNMNNTLASVEWKFKYTHFYNNLTDILKIDPSILSNVNLDFSSMVSNSVCEARNIVDNTFITSSPIISQANFNGVNPVLNINPILNFEPIYRDYTNSIGIHGNRDSLALVTNDLVLGKSKELLNYQSNILYCLINGLSPSLY
jgi:hypothetical protein